MTDHFDRSAERLDNLVAISTLKEPKFQQLGEGRYRFTLPKYSVTLEIDYLRRESHELKGELLVRCELPGARTIDGVLSVTNINLSSARTRSGHAKYLGERAGTKIREVDWDGILEEFSLRVLSSEREGSPAVLLGSLPEPPADTSTLVHGLPLLNSHPLILFGDGGTAKSYLALWLAGEMVKLGARVGYFDWELCAPDHRGRLGRLYEAPLPDIYYARCTRPLVAEVERLRRIVREFYLDYVFFDSVAFACDGRPEDAEVAGRYFQSLRSLGEIGSLHVAHISRSLEGSDLRPFGSVFWANGARSTWNVKLAENGPGSASEAIVALHHRKANLGPRHRSLGFRIAFYGERTAVERQDLAEIPELAAGLPVQERIRMALSRGPLTKDQLAQELEGIADNTLRQALGRGVRSGRILTLPGPEKRFSLVARHSESSM